MKEYIIRLVPKSSFEVELHSDTLFGAICWGIRTLFGEDKLCSVLKDFNSSPPFILSSAFPWRMADKEYKYYLPKPVLKPIPIVAFKGFAEKARNNAVAYHSDKVSLIEISDKYKKYKKIRMVPLASFRKIVKNPSEQNLFADYLDGILKEPRFAYSGVSQKNSLDRLTNSTTGTGNTFYVAEHSFREKYGLYFLLKTGNIKEYLEPVLKLLEDSGIGPNARNGKNWFSVEIEQKTLIEQQQCDAFITLSRYIGQELLDIKHCLYQTASVRSKVESRFEFAGEDIWKDRVTYLTAGSVIRPTQKSEFYGGLVPVKEIDSKIIYQYGYAYPVWLQAGGSNGI